MKVRADHRDVIDVSDSLVQHLVTPPLDGTGTCPLCRTWSTNATAGGGAAPCENCVEIQDTLGVEPVRLSVASLYRKPSELRDWLTRYKGRDDEGDPFDPDCLVKVRAILGRMLIEHGDHLEESTGALDGIVVVPSTSRPAPHPLAQLISTLDLDAELLPLLKRGHGQLDFRKPSPAGYQAVDHAPARVLLIDDVYTTGARLNSAAFALARAGHEVAGALVVARRVNPDYAAAGQELWDRATAQAFAWDSSPWI